MEQLVNEVLSWIFNAAAYLWKQIANLSITAVDYGHFSCNTKDSQKTQHFNIVILTCLVNKFEENV